MINILFFGILDFFNKLIEIVARLQSSLTYRLASQLKSSPWSRNVCALVKILF
jgi:hypothetical protein